MIDPARALPGRSTEMPIAARHAVLGTPMQPPFPEGFQQLVVGLGCFWGPRPVSGRRRASTRRQSGTPVATPRTPPTRRCAPGAPGTPRPCSWCSIRRRHQLRVVAQAVLGEPQPDPGHAAGQRRRHAVPLRDLHDLAREQRKAAEESYASGTRSSSTGAGFRADHDRDRGCRAFLLRRAVPPAVLRQEPERLLRARRHRRVSARSGLAPPSRNGCSPGCMHPARRCMHRRGSCACAATLDWGSAPQSRDPKTESMLP